ncbi:MAG: hypothetical protein LBV23_11275 [Deltaproteobacteria bacterium]|jgi:hypothetical protein|nr:hypothetical protein [Deltaproteobacteria bacterium]
MIASMVAPDSTGFETAFGDILASLPYNTHTPSVSTKNTTISYHVT